MGGVTLAFNATSDACDNEDLRVWELDPFTFSTSAHKKVFFLHIFRPGYNGTLRLYSTQLRLIFQILPLDERRELEPLGRDHSGVGAVAEVDRGLRQSALLQLRAEEDRASGGRVSSTVARANNFTLLLKIT